MSFHSAVQMQQRTDTERYNSNLQSPVQSFKPDAINTFAASRFGLDFSQVPLHANETQPVLPSRRAPLMLQRFPKNEDDVSVSCPTCPEAGSTEPLTGTTAPTPGPGAVPTPAESEPTTGSAAPGKTPAAGLIVEDSAKELGPGQMRKSEFLARLRVEVRRTVEAAIAGTGRTTEDCPYLDYWFDFYSRQDSAHIERAIRKYAPGASKATTANQYISIITQRARRAAEIWASTGEITGVPEGIPTHLPGEASAPDSEEGEAASTAPVMLKAREGGAGATDNNPLAIQAELGEGRPLEGGVRSRMESAFGVDFSHVRTHTDTTAAGLSNRFNAHAFTVGEHVAFGASEYKPGTIIGDALIAHELAHVLQQGGAGAETATTQGKDINYNSLEEDADLSAANVMTSHLSSTIPRLRSGLKLQRCCDETWHSFCLNGKKTFRNEVKSDLSTLRMTAKGWSVLQRWWDRSTITIEESSVCGADHSKNKISYTTPSCLLRINRPCLADANICGKTGDPNWNSVPNYVYLFHELVHVFRSLGPGIDECKVVGLGKYFKTAPTENHLRCELELPVRPCYGSKCANECPPVCR